LKQMKKFLLISVLLSLTLPGTALAISYGGHDYFLTSTPKFWLEAEAEAVAASGHLVTINDAAEESFLQTTFGTSRLWIGFTDQATEGTWVWISGEPVTYTNWSDHEPNDAVFGEDYAIMNWVGVKWNDVSNNNESYYGIIEVTAPLPGALLLLGTGLVGLIGLRRILQ
jgi:hypothetical protein